MRGTAVGWALGWLGGLLLACQSNGFACEDDTQCLDSGVQGRCEPNGFCSFPNPACVSGFEYGSLAGDGLAGECTDPPGTTTATDTTAASSGVVTSSGGAMVDSSSGAVTPGSSDSSDATGAGESEASTGEPIDPDLLLWLKMDDPPGDGALDSSSYGFTPMCVVCPQEVAGPLGGAYAFDDELTFFELPHDARFDAPTQMTVTAWVILPSVDATLHTIVAKPVGVASRNSWELLARDDGSGCGSCVRAGFGSSTDSVFVDTLAPIDRWFHLASTWDGAMVRLWVDGVEVDAQPGADVGIDDSPILIGADMNNLSLAGVFNGSIDDVRVYHRALTQRELADVMAGR